MAVVGGVGGVRIGVVGVGVGGMVVGSAGCGGRASTSLPATKTSSSTAKRSSSKEQSPAQELNEDLGDKTIVAEQLLFLTYCTEGKSGVRSPKRTPPHFYFSFLNFDVMFAILYFSINLDKGAWPRKILKSELYFK